MQTVKKLLGLLLSCALLATLLAGCAPAQEQKQSSSTEVSSSQAAVGGITFTDALGHTVTANNPKNVVAVSGSFAETWLLAGGKLAGVTQDAFDERNLSLDESVAKLGAMKSPNVEQIIALGSELVILSADISEHVALYDTLKSAGVPTAYFSVESFKDYLSMLKICTDITGHAELFDKNGIEIQKQIDSAIAKSQGKKAPKVLFIRAFSTGAKAKGSDNMTGMMIKDLGAENIADKQQTLLEDLSMDAIVKEDPDFILVVTMGADSGKALDALKNSIQSNPAWTGLSAVKNNRYIVLEKNLFHYKPNTRWGESYETLADIFYGKDANT